MEGTPTFSVFPTLNIQKQRKGAADVDKQTCDKIITAYCPKLFGFAAAKTGSLERAEELASRITLEVYAQLLRCERIDNVNAYVRRIAQNVYARFTDEYRRSRCIDCIDDFADSLTDGENFTESVEDAEIFIKLRCEIAYLSSLRREILVRRYYRNEKLSGIAAALDLPEGTVKWHLSGARGQLKKGLDTVRTIGMLGLSPVTLTYLGHDGHPGYRGDTADFLARRLTQNIAYAAYHAPRSVNEIADELGISPVFVEDEVKTLEEYGFMEKKGDRYLTQIYITEPKKETEDARYAVFRRYAARLTEDYIPLLLDSLNDADFSKLYIPDGDRNLWQWSGVTYALGSSRFGKPAADGEIDRFRIPRKDGGCYIAFARLDTPVEFGYDAELYSVCGNMTRSSEKYPIRSWQINTYYGRCGEGWRDNLYTDYEALYEFYTGMIGKTPENIEKYRRLRDKGYLTGDDRVNLICVRSGTASRADFSFLDALVPQSDKVLLLQEELAEEIYRLEAADYPEHKRALCKAYAGDSLHSNLLRMLIVEILMKKEILAVPDKEAARGLTTLLAADRIPD